MTDLLNQAAISGRLTATIPVEVLDCIDSTNTEAKRQIAAGARPPFLLLAEQQTGGRGRMGRSFSSPASAGLYMSLALAPDLPAGDMLPLTAAAAVAVCTAIESLTDLCPQIKWVNDIYLNDKKLCGILADGMIDPMDGRLSALVIGIGINCRAAPLPTDVAAIATSLEAAGAAVDRNLLAAAICDRLLEFYRDLPHSTWLEAYRARSWLDGKVVRCRLAGEEIEGTALGIDSSGALLLATLDGPRRIFTGEATVRLLS